jgi:hypothetical protein
VKELRLEPVDDGIEIRGIGSAVHHLLSSRRHLGVSGVQLLQSGLDGVEAGSIHLRGRDDGKRQGKNARE